MSIFKKFADSSKELSKVQALAVCAMMLAIRIVLGIVGNASLSFIPLPVVKFVALFTIPVAIAGYMYGPVCAGIVAGFGDILSYIIHPTAFGFNPAITVCYLLEGIIYGLVLYQNELSVKRLVITKAIDLLLCTLTLQSLILKLMFFQTTPFYLVVFWRAVVLIPFAAVEIAIMYWLKTPLDRIKKLKT